MLQILQKITKKCENVKMKKANEMLCSYIVKSLIYSVFINSTFNIYSISKQAKFIPPLLTLETKLDAKVVSHTLNHVKWFPSPSIVLMRWSDWEEGYVGATMQHVITNWNIFCHWQFLPVAVQRPFAPNVYIHELNLIMFDKHWRSHDITKKLLKLGP